MSAGLELLLLHKHISFCYAEELAMPKPKDKINPHNFLEITMYFNKVLEGKYSITEYRGFSKVYNTYLEWLIQKYLDESFSFDCCYKRKIENKKALKDIYDEQASHMYFLAQTLYQHLSEYRETYSYCFKDEYHYTIVYKMYLAVRKIMHIAEYKCLSKYDTEQIENITKGMIDHTFKKYIEEYDYLNEKFERDANNFS